MKAFLDTAVLVPVFYGDHQHHEASLNLFLRFGKDEACCAAHSMAEVYASLTRMPGKHRISGEQAMLFVATIRDRLTIVTLDAVEYFHAIEEASAAGVTGGTIYDAVLAWCAAKAKAEVIYTWNIKHYQQFVTDRKLRTP